MAQMAQMASESMAPVAPKSADVTHTSAEPAHEEALPDLLSSHSIYRSFTVCVFKNCKCIAGYLKRS